jgi:hypothetical protein
MLRVLTKTIDKEVFKRDPTIRGSSNSSSKHSLATKFSTSDSSTRYNILIPSRRSIKNTNSKTSNAWRIEAKTTMIDLAIRIGATKDLLQDNIKTFLTDKRNLFNGVEVEDLVIRTTKVTNSKEEV